MGIYNSTGATTYPNPNQMQTNVQGPAYEVAPWKPIEYAPTPEYAPLSWQMRGIRGGWPPTMHGSSTPGPSDSQRMMEKMAIQKAQMELEDFAKARQPLPSAMRMDASGRWAPWVDPALLTINQQMQGLQGGMYSTPSGGGWRGATTMFGGLPRAQGAEGTGVNIGELAAERERQAAEKKKQQQTNPNTPPPPPPPKKET